MMNKNIERKKKNVGDDNTATVEDGVNNRYVVLFHKEFMEDGIRKIRELTDIKIETNEDDFATSAAEIEFGSRFSSKILEIAVVDASAEAATILRNNSGGRSPIAIVVPDLIMEAASSSGLNPQLPENDSFLRGFTVGYTHGAEETLKRLAPLQNGQLAHVLSPPQEKTCTWGLRMTGADRSQASGRGVRVAVLDTGFDRTHPDFKPKDVQGKSFIPGEVGIIDANGHGTHCTGIAFGPRNPSQSPVRYGCACDADIFVGKVLSHDNKSGKARGTATAVLEAISWAVANNYHIISMSLGVEVKPSDPWIQVFEAVAERALHSTPGTLLIASTGNNSQRPDYAAPALLPAMCPSVLGVGAVNEDMQIAKFSNGGEKILAPGVDIESILPVSHGSFGKDSGTSMATAYVAGLAALWWDALAVQDRDKVSAKLVWEALRAHADRGVAQAPI